MWDTAVALAIAVFVAVRAVLLGREVVAVLGQHAPAGIHPDAAEAALRERPPTSSTSTTSTCGPSRRGCTSRPPTSCAPTAPTPVTSSPEAGTRLREEFGIDHATLQVEPRGTRSCVETSW